jgi:hypothetical protein
MNTKRIRCDLRTIGALNLGIDSAFDKTEGIAQGRRVADYVFANAFAPRGGSGR